MNTELSPLSPSIKVSNNWGTLQDPWGYEYEYLNPAPDGSPYGIRSFGADGLEGGEGKNADITSWE